MKYRVWMSTKVAVGRTYYDGKVDVEASDAETAIQEAVRRASRVHGHSEFNVKSVELRR